MVKVRAVEHGVAEIALAKHDLGVVVGAEIGVFHDEHAIRQQPSPPPSFIAVVGDAVIDETPHDGVQQLRLALRTDPGGYGRNKPETPIDPFVWNRGDQPAEADDDRHQQKYERNLPARSLPGFRLRPQSDVPFPLRRRMLHDRREQDQHREAEDHREAMPIGDPHLMEREELDLEIKQRDDRQHREGHIDDQLRHQPGDAIGFGAGQDLREHVGMHPLAGDVPGSCLQLVGGQRIGEPAIFPRQEDVLHQERQVHQQQHRRRVLKETDERNVRIDDGQPDRTVEKQVLVADGCERHHHIGEKQEKGEPGGPGRIAGCVGFVEESLHFF